MVERANVIAGLFNDTIERQTYTQAARNLRFPYWDWSLNPPKGEGVFLPEFQTPRIRVYGPNGWQSIPNPLFSYKFHPLESNTMGPFSPPVSHLHQ
jgi:tyrosinase